MTVSSLSEMILTSNVSNITTLKKKKLAHPVRSFTLSGGNLSEIDFFQIRKHRERLQNRFGTEGIVTHSNTVNFKW